MGRALKVAFLNENLGGHATIHHALREGLAGDPRIDPTFLDVPRPGTARRLAGARIPGLDRLDLDLQPLRAQLAAAAVARRLVASAPPFDVLHVYSQNAGLLLPRAVLDRPVVVSTDSTNALNQVRLPYRRPTRFTATMLRPTLRFERRLLDRAALVVAQSAFAAASLRDDYGVAAPTLRVARFGIAGPPSAVARPGEGRPTITFVGASMDRKGGTRLRRLFDRHLRDRATLTLVTREPVPDGEGVTVRTDVGAGSTALWDVLGASSLLVLPSEIDQSPNVVLEAMAAGLPVVASRHGAIPEVVEHGETGLLVGDDDDSLLEAVAALVDDPALRARMGRAGRARFERDWDVHRTAPALVDLLLDAAGQPGRR